MYVYTSCQQENKYKLHLCQYTEIISVHANITSVEISFSFSSFDTFIIIGDIVLKVWCLTNGDHAISTFITINLVVYVLQLNMRILRQFILARKAHFNGWQ